MKYKTKLFFAFSSLVFVSALLALFISYTESSKVLFNQIRGQMLSIASTSATFIDGDLVQSIDGASSSANPAYQKLLYELRAVRDANRRADLYVKYVYLIKPQGNHQHYIFLMDAEEVPSESSQYGDIFPTDEELYKNFDHPFVDSNYTYDHWGEWISAFAPIKNSSGTPVALIGLDVSVAEIHAKLEGLLVYGGIALLIALLISVLIAQTLVRLVTNSLSAIVDTVETIAQGDLSARIELNTNDEFDDLAFAINAMVKGLQERDRLKSGFARYVSSYVLDRILKSDTPTHLEGERRKVTILFSDIRGFTTLSEQLPPEQVVSLLNEYFERMLEVIFKFNGTLDKFIGDGIMVEFGAPLEDQEQEKHAVSTAIEMQRQVSKLNEKWKGENKPQIRVGIGIHTGMAIVGNIGSEIRMEYTAVGDCVNVASRLEQATKEHHKSILISESTYQPVSAQFTAESIGKIVLTGREEYIGAYAIDPDKQPSL